MTCPTVSTLIFFSKSIVAWYVRPRKSCVLSWLSTVESLARDTWRFYDSYQQRTDRAIPVVRLQRVGG